MKARRAHCRHRTERAARVYRGPAPPAAEICDGIKKTKPPTRRTSGIVHIKPYPPFRTPEAALNKKQDRMLIGDDHKILQMFIMSNIF